MHTKTDQHELYDEYTEKLKTTYDETKRNETKFILPNNN